MKTYLPKVDLDQRKWHVVDADGAVLGRLAVQVTNVLRGRHKPTYTSHLDAGDFVVVINAEKVRMTGKKWTDRTIFTHSGYNGGQREHTPTMLRAKHPERLIEWAVRGMLPKTRLGNQLFRSLHVYAGTEHPHTAQNPKELKF